MVRSNKVGNFFSNFAPTCYGYIELGYISKYFRPSGTIFDSQLFLRDYLRVKTFFRKGPLLDFKMEITSANLPPRQKYIIILLVQCNML